MFVLSKISRGWQSLTQYHSGYSLPQLPDNIAQALYSYQKIGVGWLYYHRGRGILADDMGLGKSLQTTAYLTTLGKTPAQTLMVCPPSLIHNWQNELLHWGDLSSYVYQNDQNSTLDINPSVVITTYDALLRSERLQNHAWKQVAFDEAQALKNMLTGRWQVANKLKAQAKLCLTGTPIENSVTDLYALLMLTCPEIVRDFTPQTFEEFSQQRPKAFKKHIRPHVIVRRKEDFKEELGLPEKKIHTVSVGMTPEQKSLYEKVLTNGLDNHGWEPKGVLALLNELSLAANGPAWMGKEGFSGKDVWLKKFLSEQDKPHLLFTRYVIGLPHLEKLIHSLGWKTYQLIGNDSKAKRQKTIQAWRDDPSQKKIFMISLKAGGAGLNLTEAVGVIHYSRWYNPAVEDQATDRSYRIGQTQDVNIYNLVTEGTLESKYDTNSDYKRVLREVIRNKNKKQLRQLCA